jgi:hypothetical protein
MVCNGILVIIDSFLSKRGVISEDREDQKGEIKTVES